MLLLSVGGKERRGEGCVGQVNGRSYIRLGIKSAIVSCLSMNSPTPMPIRAIPSQSRELRACAWRSHTRSLLFGGGGGAARGGRKKGLERCTKIQVPGVHRGSTLRPRHVFATPAHRCLGAPLRWGPQACTLLLLLLLSSSSSSPSWRFLIFLPLSLASFFYSF